jgi:hypothetical protein
MNLHYFNWIHAVKVGRGMVEGEEGGTLYFFLFVSFCRGKNNPNMTVSSSLERNRCYYEALEFNFVIVYDPVMFSFFLTATANKKQTHKKNPFYSSHLNHFHHPHPWGTVWKFARSP